MQPHRTTTSSPHCVHLLLTGEAGVSQEEPEDVVSGLIPGLPEAVYICGTDQSLGAPETPQRPLSHQNPGQQPRVQVRRLLVRIDVSRVGKRCNFPSMWFQRGVAMATDAQLSAGISRNGPRHASYQSSPPGQAAHGHQGPDGTH